MVDIIDYVEHRYFCKADMSKYDYEKMMMTFPFKCNCGLTAALSKYNEDMSDYARLLDIQDEYYESKYR